MNPKKQKLYQLGIQEKDFYEYAKSDLEGICKTHGLIIGIGYFDHTPSFDAEAMEKAYFELLSRNDAFRIRLVKRSFFPRQFFQEVSEFPRPKRVHLNGGYESFCEKCKNPEYPDITMFSNQLTEAVIYCCDDNTGGIIIWQHHICSDGYSIGVLMRKQFCEFYDSYKRGETPIKPKKLYSFSDYLEWEKRDIKENWFTYIKWFMKEYNRHFFRYYAPKLDDVPTNSLEVEIKGERFDAFEELCRSNMYSDTSVMMAVMAILVHEKLKNRRFNFQMETHGRKTFAQKNTCGPILNEIRVFFEINDTDTLKEVLSASYNKVVEANMYYGLSEEWHQNIGWILQRAFHIWDRDVDWMLINNMRAYNAGSVNSLDVVTIKQPDTGSGYNIDVMDLNNGSGILFSVNYNPNITKDDELAQNIDKYIKILDLVCKKPEMTVGECLKSISEK